MENPEGGMWNSEFGRGALGGGVFSFWVEGFLVVLLRMIYLDHNATTPLAPAALEAMLPFLREEFGNPSSSYRLARRARAALEKAREQVAALLQTQPREVVFTGGATEATQAALESCLRLQPKREALVVSAMEHSATLRFAEALEEEGRARVVRVPVDGEGRLLLDELERILSREAAAVVSVMAANNETGVLQPIPEIAERCARAGVPFHCDAAQAVGKIPVDLAGWGVDFATLAAHKFSGPKGVGALYVRELLRFVPRQPGGGQEEGRRSGTENVAGVVGMGAAAELAGERLAAGELDRVGELRDEFESGLAEAFPECLFHGRQAERVPTVTSFSLARVPSAELLLLLDERGVCASAGSACSSGRPDPSHVLLAMGRSREEAQNSLRLSLGAETTRKEVGEALRILLDSVGKIRSARG